MLNKLILLLVIIVNYFLLHIQELVFLSGVCIRVCCHSWHVELCRVEVTVSVFHESLLVVVPLSYEMVCSVLAWCKLGL